MKRIPLFAHSEAPGRPWNLRVVDALCKSDHAEVLRLIGMPGGKRKMREGFPVAGENNNPLAQLCLHLNEIDALRVVVAAAPNGVTLHDCCVHHIVDEPRGRAPALEVYTEMTLHEAAVSLQYANPSALALALEFEPEHPCLTEEVLKHSDATLHFQSLAMASGQGQEEQAGRYAECCRLLLAHGAPVRRKTEATEHSPLAELLFGRRWRNPGHRDAMAPLVGEYLRAGWFDLNAVSNGGRSPVEQAVVCGNGAAAAALIDLGCALEPVNFPEHADLISLARQFAPVDEEGSCLPLVTAALMRRQLAGHASPAGRPAPAARRAARAGL